MYIEPKLKPLFANLKRLQIGKYLYSKEFKLYTLENDIDEIWQKCKQEVIKKKKIFSAGHHNSEEEEEAFMYLLSSWYYDYENYDDLLFPILLNYASWSILKVDLTELINNIKQLHTSKARLLKFTNEYRSIQKKKPVQIIVESKDISTDKELKPDNKNIFVVHGRDDNSRLELCSLIKDEFKLEPIVLQDKPNDTFETIITKFERLANQCAVAIVLFTPDDEVGENKRARQNVIFELGYFLGKFYEKKARKIIILKKGNIEIPSDISGVIYFEYQLNVKEIYFDLKKQFEYWGYSI